MRLDKTTLDYKEAGVDISAGNLLVSRIKPIAQKTHIAGVMAGLGGFGSLFELPLKDYENPVLVSGTDGVGTKLKLAIEMNQHDTIGIDLVAMCVNDIVVLGAKPLFFLDYFASGKLNVDVAEQVIKGIGQGCEMAGCALVGGETAEMPGVYAEGDYDLAGFCVGIVEKSRIIDGSRVEQGDKLIGLAASGVHSNGFSLVRKILERQQVNLNEPFDGSTLGQVLLTPTRIYVQSVLRLLESVSVHALAHITGGGLTENLPRVIPSHLKANINLRTWQFPAVFDWLQSGGNVLQADMLLTFNCGIGMVLCVAPSDEQRTLEILETLGEKAMVIGHVSANDDGVKVHYLAD